MTLSLPYALPPPEFARDLLRELDAPALSVLAARGRVAARAANTSAWPRAMPHEQWLARQCGLPERGEDDSPALARAAMRGLGLPADGGVWFLLRPIHVEVARNGLLLTDPRRLALDEAEARALHAEVRPLFTELGMDLLFGDAANWFLRADRWLNLRSATPDCALGQHLEPLMPAGAHARDWRRLQNEVQMVWHASAVNDARERRGQPVVNGLWLHGRAGAADAGTPLFDRAYEAPGQAPQWQLDGALGRPVQRGGDPFGGDGHALLHVDALADSALAEDWGSWLLRMRELEETYFAPLLAALRDGRIGRATLALSARDRLLVLDTTRGALRKFWVRPTLARLLP